nr:hypothetical protein GCM10020092_075050 [Actinoplanes digitatis]
MPPDQRAQHPIELGVDEPVHHRQGGGGGDRGVCRLGRPLAAHGAFGGSARGELAHPALALGRDPAQVGEEPRGGLLGPVDRARRDVAPPQARGGRGGRCGWVRGR